MMAAVVRLLTGFPKALARNYETRSQFQLAIPLLFHALRLCEDPCHRPVISTAPHPSSPFLLSFVFLFPL